MKTQKKYILKVCATGFVVLLLLSLPLFWARFICKIILIENASDFTRRVGLERCVFIPKKTEKDPNTIRHSYVSAQANISELIVFNSLGLMNYIKSHDPYSQLMDFLPEPEIKLYFDKTLGLFVYNRIIQRKMPDNTTVIEKIKFYAGPEGIAETPDANIGKFDELIIENGPSSHFIVYDKKQLRFFLINFAEKTITKGPEIEIDKYQPIQIGWLQKNSEHLGQINWEPPVREGSYEEAKKFGIQRGHDEKYRIPLLQLDIVNPAGRYTLVLGKTGQIFLLDRNTLTIEKSAGYLPAPKALFNTKDTVTAEDLLGFIVKPITFTDTGEYRGMYVASVSRDGISMALAAFNDKGRLIASQHSASPDQSKRGRSSSEAFFFDKAGSPLVTTIKYLLENLQPPFVSMVTYFTAFSFEAGVGHRSLFILPDSFVAVLGRCDTERFLAKLFAALIMILPSLALSILLAWRVVKDAVVVGLSKNERTYWLIGTICFGLAAYITYRLTKPKIKLVTCQNCGNLRRPDMEECHRCGSKWIIPEIVPPAWRVID